jgi:transposase-like protein
VALKRLQEGKDLDRLAKELGVSRRSLYRWRSQADPATDKRKEAPLSNADVSEQVVRLSRLLAEKTLETDFFRNALQKVEARRQRRGTAGEKASTTRSGT